MIRIYNRFNGELIKEFNSETLKGADLRDADLRRANLIDADLSGANLSDADLSDANLSRADLRRANLIYADLSDADLSGANLTGAAIIGYGLAWPVYVTKNSIRIGCKSYNLEQWENFSDDEISNMHDNALAFWKENKEMLIDLCRRLSK